MYNTKCGKPIYPYPNSCVMISLFSFCVCLLIFYSYCMYFPSCYKQYLIIYLLLFLFSCSVKSHSWESMDWDFPGKNTGVGCCLLLQGIFQHRDWTWVSCTADRSFTTEPLGNIFGLFFIPSHIFLPYARASLAA